MCNFALIAKHCSRQELIKKHKVADVAVIKVGDFENSRVNYHSGVTQMTEPEIAIVCLPKSNILTSGHVPISNDVFLFGYPSSLGAPDEKLDPYIPLLRKGITAGKDGDGHIIIDCPVYFGNSGGLVIQVQDNGNLRGIGLAVRMIPFVEELWSRQLRLRHASQYRFENSGYTVVEPMDRVLDLID